MKIEDSEVYTTPLNGFFQWKTRFFILHSMHAFTAQKCTNGPNHLNLHALISMSEILNETQFISVQLH